MTEQIRANGTGTCPHCGKGIQFLETESSTPGGWFRDSVHKNRALHILTVMCPLCRRPIIALEHYMEGGSNNQTYLGGWFIWPRSAARNPIPKDVPSSICEDYQEAALVLADSEKASAALSRRCLQSLLREAARTKSKDLSDQIEEVLNTLPAYLREQIDAVRNIGNFAAHPQKSKTTGEIIDVEPGEAEWNLDVLDMLFDFYYEQPRIAREKRDALDKKLREAGKPPMK